MILVVVDPKHPSGAEVFDLDGFERVCARMMELARAAFDLMARAVEAASMALGLGGRLDLDELRRLVDSFTTAAERCRGDAYAASHRSIRERVILDRRYPPRRPSTEHLTGFRRPFLHRRFAPR